MWVSIHSAAEAGGSAGKTSTTDLFSPEIQVRPDPRDRSRDLIELKGRGGHARGPIVTEKAYSDDVIVRLYQEEVLAIVSKAIAGGMIALCPVLVGKAAHELGKPGIAPERAEGK